MHQWAPVYAITPVIAQALMQVEAAKAVVARTPLSPTVVARLREQARLRSTHYSTYIEGNRLTLAETQQAVERREVTFHGRERDVAEVRQYWQALLRVEEWAARQAPLTEELISRLHALLEYGPRTKATPYRDGQNAIRDSRSGELIYLPPEARDVPPLMTELVGWVRQAGDAGVPAPIIAGLAHYQLVTIHPFYDGNGRTARLLATFLLHREGYGLSGFFSLEEHHARDLDAYYRALAAHPHHNYYFGRADADLTPWLEYFTGLLSRVFVLAQEEALACARDGMPSEPEGLRRLDPRARTVLALFAKHDAITASMVAAALGLSPRMARNLLTAWVEDGWLAIAGKAKKNRSYVLTAQYRQYIGIFTMPENER
ncbi:MAG: Fic family protein [Armatimonadota bacterium]